MSNFDAIFAACFDSSTLFSNLIEIALIFTSGHVFCNNAKTSVESTPLLRAIEVFVCAEFLIILLIFEQIRFSIIEQSGSKMTYNKIVSLMWSYVSMNLNFDDRLVNPLGFQVTSYSISNDLGA